MCRWVNIELARGLRAHNFFISARAELCKQFDLLRPRQIPQTVENELVNSLGRRSDRVRKRQMGYPCVTAICIQTLAVKLYELSGELLS